MFCDATHNIELYIFLYGVLLPAYAEEICVHCWKDYMTK